MSKLLPAVLAQQELLLRKGYISHHSVGTNGLHPMCSNLLSKMAEVIRQPPTQGSEALFEVHTVVRHGDPPRDIGLEFGYLFNLDQYTLSLKRFTAGMFDSVVQMVGKGNGEALLPDAKEVYRQLAATETVKYHQQTKPHHTGPPSSEQQLHQQRHRKRR